MQIIKGDILSNINPGIPTYVLHGCNCFHTMGAGIARYLANKYPEVLEADKKTKYGDREKLGTFSMAEVQNNLTIVNCYTQYRYGKGKHVNYTAVALCLVSLSTYLRNRYVMLEHIDIRAPKIGCGLAGGDWNVVKSIMNAIMPSITIYEK